MCVLFPLLIRHGTKMRKETGNRRTWDGQMWWSNAVSNGVVKQGGRMGWSNVVAPKFLHPNYARIKKFFTYQQSEISQELICITHHASHNCLANAEEISHIMSSYIRHACHTVTSRKPR